MKSPAMWSTTFKTFCSYFYGHLVWLQTDNTAVSWMKHLKKNNNLHHPGLQHLNTDTLSRVPVKQMRPMFTAATIKAVLVTSQSSRWLVSPPACGFVYVWPTVKNYVLLVCYKWTEAIFILFQGKNTLAKAFVNVFVSLTSHCRPILILDQIAHQDFSLTCLIFFSYTILSLYHNIHNQRFEHFNPHRDAYCVLRAKPVKPEWHSDTGIVSVFTGLSPGPNLPCELCLISPQCTGVASRKRHFDLTTKRRYFAKGEKVWLIDNTNGIGVSCKLSFSEGGTKLYRIKRMAVVDVCTISLWASQLYRDS
ncbi:hypothetical protein MAR_037897 [Mya arenaria]|uniref:Uncharacterized protein n=1 Tax=Mya arenaria TaxID=6604 RepID=A0ABY7FPU0_MYAAR|nr:hypothetical protein MAR_037897 [Mya arenaria]